MQKGGECVQKYGYELDAASYEMGYINCSSEMVAAGVKPYALSHPVGPQALASVEMAAKYLTDSYGIHYSIDRRPRGEDTGSAVFVLYREEAQLEAYLAAGEGEP